MSLFNRIRAGLMRTREAATERLSVLFRRNQWDPDALEEVEELLLTADLGVAATDRLMEILRQAGRDVSSRLGDPAARVKEALAEILNGLPPSPKVDAKPYVILLVGVNGTGKTTTAGKLAHHFAQQGLRCAIAAADTFRAAAIEQLEVWAKRGGARLISQAPGADPAAVAFDAYSSCRAQGDDVLIVDTAGRLQARQNLMDELAKIRRVLGRLDPSSPHETLLVLDATTGQNGLSQARGFLASAGATGLIVTKLDGTARGGIVVPIRQELGLPITYLGLGEGISDLQLFDAKVYVDALLAE
ncbi:MAG: signal recognition particle-docking protein FtsY [Calditrichaeota bacterium]|nr:signal recognition particle-docking protein FtsY [Calditrichota bacterium]